MDIEKLDDYRWKIARSGRMHVPGIVYASEKMLRRTDQKQPLQQVANVACLPGIVGASLAMPDMHWGYGFPIGGVAAFDWSEGVISPGGVGYDINCGVRLATTALEEPPLRKHLENLVNTLYREIPTGVGSSGLSD